MLEKFLGHKVEHHELDLPEIQSLDLHEVAEQKAKDAYKILKKPVLIDDVALNIHALGGLPGTFVKFFLKAMGGAGICKMVDAYSDRSATAAIVFGFYDGSNFQAIHETIDGKISAEPRGDSTKLTMMGWNTIIIPAGQPKTIAEMSEEDLIKYTPRGKAIPKLKTLLAN